jgi:hypothetical protein
MGRRDGSTCAGVSEAQRPRNANHGRADDGAPRRTRATRRVIIKWWPGASLALLNLPRADAEAIDRAVQHWAASGEGIG